MLKTSPFLRQSSIFNIISAIVLYVCCASALQAQENYFNKYGADFEVSSKVVSNGKLYGTLQVADSLNMQLRGTITEVCQAKGCWMKVDLEDDREVFVRFKDYAFFVPTDVAGKTVLLNGVAFVEEMGVEEQRHYAEDKGMSKEEVAQIATPKRTLRFQADGVRINK